MITQPAVSIRCSQFHCCASCRQLPPLLCSVPVNVTHILGSKSHCFFFSVTIVPHCPLYMAPSSLSLCLLDHFLSFSVTLFRLFYAEEACGSSAPSLGWGGGALTSRKLQITIQGLRVYYCMQPCLQRPLASWNVISLNLCPLKLWRSWSILCHWEASGYLLRHIEHLAYNKDIFQMFTFEKHQVSIG